MITKDNFTRVSNDVNGNPRYVMHFSQLVTDSEREKAKVKAATNMTFFYLDEVYKAALKRAKQIGGRKFHNKQYGGGIVFQSYNLQNTCNLLNDMMQVSETLSK